MVVNVNENSLKLFDCSIQYSFQMIKDLTFTGVYKIKEQKYVCKKTSLFGDKSFSILAYTCFEISEISLLVAIVVRQRLKLPSTSSHRCLAHIIILVSLVMLVSMICVGASDVNIICETTGALLHFLW